MSSHTQTAYDAVVYHSRPQSVTHPDGLAALALLHGLSPAPLDNCRVLEIGCATGGNIFSVAESYPDSQFVAIDPSRRQIDIARQAASAVGLSNLRLEAVGAEALDSSWGHFDYIICHGVYSWVPPHVRQAILALCGNLLSPHGVAYVSYNTRPGWHLRLPVREMMRFHTRTTQAPPERVAQARALLRFVADNVLQPDGAWAKLVRQEAELSSGKPDFYVLHEHLEEENEAFYFHEFMADAARHGLTYLCEAAHHAHPSVLPGGVRQALADAGVDDLLQLEQYVDFLRGRMFRRTLLVRAEAPVLRTHPPELLGRLYLSAMARPDQPGPVDINSPAPVRFANDDDDAIETDEPLLKAALTELLVHWPAAVSWDGLWRGALARLPDAGRALTAEHRPSLGRALIRLYWSGLVALHAGPSPFTLQPGERPTASRLARLQASAGVPICTRRHRTAELSPFDEALLTLLDGSRDKMALAQELSRRASPPTPPEALAPEVDAGLHRLARSALLVA